MQAPKLANRYPCETCKNATQQNMASMSQTDRIYPQTSCTSCTEECRRALRYPCDICSDKQATLSTKPAERFRDRPKNRTMSTEGHYKTPCVTCSSGKTSMSNLEPSQAVPPANVQYELSSTDTRRSPSKSQITTLDTMTCPSTSKATASTSCEHWTELIKKVVQENLKSLSNVNNECSESCQGKELTKKLSKVGLQNDVPSTRICPMTDAVQSTFGADTEVNDGTTPDPNGEKLELNKAQDNTVCSSARCPVDHQACKCHYPPAFKQVGCTGRITGTCECEKRN